MSLIPNTVTRSVDPTGEQILVFETPTGELVQAVAIVDDGATAVVSYNVNDVEEVGNVTYVGKETGVGAWLVQRVDASSGLQTRYATVANNPGVVSYADAWSARAALSYGTYSEAS